EQLGEAFLDRVEGRFALVLEYRARRRALLARDGLGHQGLAYALDRERLLVASDPADLVAARGVDGSLDEQRLAEFFASEELSGSRTFFRGVHAVLPGEVLVVEGDRESRRWLRRPALRLALEIARFEPLVERFAERLTAAVERCLRGGGPVVVLGGGGLDSSPIAALAARRLGEGPPILSWRVSGPEADESGFVEALARHLGSPLHWIPGDDAGPFGELASWPVHPSTPEQTAYRTLHQRSYARAAELGARVVLTGFGGDSLYTHGRRWLWGLLASEGPGAAIDALRDVAAAKGWVRALRSHVVGPLLPRRRARAAGPRPWLTGRCRELLAGRPRWPDGVERARRPRQAERLMALLDGHGEQVERHYTEPFGLEQRQPLRDLDLVELALALPDHVLGRGTETRCVLRAAMRGRLPEEVLARRGKASFRRLIDEALAPDRRRWMGPLLEREDALWRGYVEPAAVARWLDGRFGTEAEIVALLDCVHAELWRERRPRPPAQ
ncbi:MAG TPA: asparagine synthase C-terminal domain-containing protein, partial [Thermoanaerobaculia bacterium]|nr:asparagine synthase C-terminal domain-containing protein [Thermoanaerobaculia bacterium]